ncbi:AAA family ATPase, partial [Rhodovarius sp.]
MSGRVLGVASGKGGVGKTVLAIGLAQALAEAGERVLLIDADLGLANVDVQLGLPAGPDLGMVLAGRLGL